MWASTSMITWSRVSLRRTCIAAIGVIFIAPVLARQAISVTDWSPSCWHCIWPLATKPWSCRLVRVWYHGVDPMHHPGFQTPGFTKCAHTGPKNSVDLIHHIFQLCLSCQVKVFDIGGQLQFMSIEGWLLKAPWISLPTEWNCHLLWIDR